MKDNLSNLINNLVMLKIYWYEKTKLQHESFIKSVTKEKLEELIYELKKEIGELLKK